MKRVDGFKTKDIDLICFLRFRGFSHLQSPMEDEGGTRWVIFNNHEDLDKEVMDFMQNNYEAKFLHEFRATRKFILDSEPMYEKGRSAK